ncbi:MAG: thioredoxin-dependent thiol peroxidase [Crocinitomicaceae bacterium]|jgi:thioredoxin-dependent peroxiredoxin|nr:thioredoxin-dependent thiol peroxidase [Crocinitomicaceae bacterium]MDP4760045.1 thioredoxin-dependent thiol peroxidase [Crocinitomicaceae bacterium]
MNQLNIGSTLPAFVGVDQNGEEINSNDFSGKRLVVYFYPKDNTPGCTAQACSLRDDYSTLLENNIAVIGVSADSVSSHKKFMDKFQLPFPLIADTEKTLLNLFGVWGPKKFMGKTYDGIHRTSFLFDETGNLMSIIEKPNTKNHAQEILAIYTN